MNPTSEEVEEEWQLIPESECDDQEDYPDDEAIRSDIAGWQDEVAAREQGSGTREVSNPAKEAAA